MFNSLFRKSIQYLVLINYDKSFEISAELLNAICSQPTIALKPHEYYFLNEKYESKVVSSSSILKVNYSSMVNVSILSSKDSLNPLLLIGVGRPKGFNSVVIHYEDSGISKLISYLKDYFSIDYGFICKCKAGENISKFVYEGDPWQTSHKKVCQGLLKDVYTVNILKSTHFPSALKSRIEEDENMGEIDFSIDDYLIWRVAPSNIRHVRRQCMEMGILI